MPVQQKDSVPGERRANAGVLYLLGLTAAIAWGTWAYFLFVLDVGSSSRSDLWRIAYDVVIFLAPAITFTPLALRFRWPWFAPYAIIAWAAWGYLLAFVRPAPEILMGERSPLSTWYFFLVLLAVLTSVLAPLAHWIGLRFLVSRTHRHDWVRPWREALLFSLYLVGLAVGRSLGLLTWPIALLSLLLLVLVEALFLARKG
ncbi:MAG: hypothetical protein ACP5SI_12835 [Chloroflexia bacterium]